jgi:hypothetical protein
VSQPTERRRRQRSRARWSEDTNVSIRALASGARSRGLERDLANPVVAAVGEVDVAVFVDGQILGLIQVGIERDLSARIDGRRG